MRALIQPEGLQRSYGHTHTHTHTHVQVQRMARKKRNQAKNRRVHRG